MLRMMADENFNGKLESLLYQGTTRGSVDDGVQSVLQKSNSTVGKAWSYITAENFWALDLFVHVSRPQHELCEHMASQVKSLADSTKFNQSFLTDGWRQELVSTVRNAFYDVPKLRKICAVDDESRRMDVFQFCCQLVKVRYDEDLMNHAGYPARFLTVVLAADEEALVAERHLLDRHWQWVVSLESASSRSLLPRICLTTCSFSDGLQCAWLLSSNFWRFGWASFMEQHSCTLYKAL